MIQSSDLTPFILTALGLLTAALGWLFKTVIQMGKDVVAIQTTLKLYFENQGKGAARLLDTPNPAPEHIRLLLKEYRRGTLTSEKLTTLKQWLRETMNDQNIPRDERGMAMQFLDSMEAAKQLDRIKPHRWWQLWN